jgi:small ligand-binding sensory domain FIST
MVGAFADGDFRILPTLDKDLDQMAADDRAWIDATEPTFAIVHGDPTNDRTPALVDSLAESAAGFLVGGLTSSRGAHHQVAGDVTDGGLSGVLFAPTVDVATSLSQGCTPMAETHIITDCQDNVLMSLDGRPALEVFKEDIGELLAHDLQRVAGYVHAALPIEGTDTGDYTVRNLVAIDPERGFLAIGAAVQPGERVLFVRRDPASAIEDMQAMLDRLKRRLDGPPAGGVYFSCLARGPNMFGSADLEMSMIRDTLGDFPVVGFFGEGEISNCRLYGYTGVLAVFI